MPDAHTRAATAGTWTLGDRTVNRIGFGSKRLAGTVPSTGDRERAVAVLRRAVELGVNHIDTALFYPSYMDSGQSVALFWANEVIRRALAPYPEDLVIVTKVGPAGDRLARPEELRGQVEANLRALSLDQLDVVNLRQYGLESIDEHFGALSDMRDEGLIRHLGVSNVRAEHLAQAQRIAPVVCIQNRYGVDFGRVNDTLLAPHARPRHIGGRLGPAFLTPHRVQRAPGRPINGVLPELRVPHQHRVMMQFLEPRNGVVRHDQLCYVEQTGRRGPYIRQPLTAGPAGPATAIAEHDRCERTDVQPPNHLDVVARIYVHIRAAGHMLISLGQPRSRRRTLRQVRVVAPRHHPVLVRLSATLLRHVPLPPTPAPGRRTAPIRPHGDAWP